MTDGANTEPNLDWRQHAFRPDLADARLEGQVSAARFVEGTLAAVARPSVPLLRRPETLAPMDSQLLHGERVRVFERKEGWAWVQSETDGYVGYVREEALAEGLPAATHRVLTGQTVVLSDDKQIAAPLHTLSMGAKVAVAEAGERFQRLETGGFVFAEHLVPLGHREDDWVAVADRMLGLPYLWGGRGHGGIDCSGLVQMALSACEIETLRDSDQQAGSIGNSAPLDPGTWRHGDLLYTKGHVLIARGTDEVIHATGDKWCVAIEDQKTAISRLYAKGLPVISVRRPSLPATQ